MMSKISVFFFFFMSFSGFSQITSTQLLDKAIAYHDPESNWSSFNNKLHVTMETPSGSNRVTDIQINLKADYFKAEETKDSVITTYLVKKGQCKISISDSLRIASLETKPVRSHCESTYLYKNYYTYLYGLPMKLKDPGTHISEKIERKTFKGKSYLVLKAAYDKGVGTDVWYFYFDPETFAMEVYQFYKTDDNGKMRRDSGEYILLTGEETINGIKIPKTRAWYYNKDNKYLGTDILNK